MLCRKRHIAVYSLFLLLAVKITSANVQYQNRLIPLVKPLLRLCPSIKTVVVYRSYKTLFIESVQSTANRVFEVVKPPDFAKVFVLLPKRSKVEQTIPAFTISRPLNVDYETLLHVSAAAMLFASITRLLASITMTSKPALAAVAVGLCPMSMPSLSYRLFGPPCPPRMVERRDGGRRVHRLTGTKRK